VDALGWGGMGLGRAWLRTWGAPGRGRGPAPEPPGHSAAPGRSRWRRCASRCTPWPRRCTARGAWAGRVGDWTGLVPGARGQEAAAPRAGAAPGRGGPRDAASRATGPWAPSGAPGPALSQCGMWEVGRRALRRSGCLAFSCAGFRRGRRAAGQARSAGRRASIDAAHGTEPAVAERSALSEKPQPAPALLTVRTQLHNARVGR